MQTGFCKDYGSKSVSLSNIIQSYNLASAQKGTIDEFGLNDTVIKRIKEHGALAADFTPICMNVLAMRQDKSIRG